MQSTEEVSSGGPLETGEMSSAGPVQSVLSAEIEAKKVFCRVSLLIVVLHIRSSEDNTTLQDIVPLLSFDVVKSLPRLAPEVWKSWV